jgi:sterol desaturase/sphingolipid hydroxylase (fatty acid hydroxylase superfamily)
MSGRVHGRWLWVLLGLFVVRVAAQPLARLTRWSALPAFESWQSGALPYALLFPGQLLLIAFMASIAARVSSGAIAQSPRKGRILLGIAALYAMAAVGRLILGATVLQGHWWFDAPLPSMFHIVLAAFVAAYGDYHARMIRRAAPWIIYPTIMVSAYAMFAALQMAGVSLVLSTYIPILISAAAITTIERLIPFRDEWQPAKKEVFTDLTFMVVVQLALPPLVSLLFALALIEPARSLGLPMQSWWPHGLPIWLQAVLMVLAVDFMRYWLHRFSHENDTMWKLHSVHHSVEQLYWLNTGRFHPIEKTLQMSLDSLPFVLMGVDPQVLALYYLSYATNGFFQHCNIELRYGVLNYVVGSAETHRWHHSREPRESNANYGNTVIVWDLLFGTWFLPNDRGPEAIGLRDPNYPTTFLRLMKAPFSRPTSAQATVGK